MISVLTAGVDLSSQDKKSAMCVIAWGHGTAKVERLQLGASDADIVSVVPEAAKTGIDVPFGWPVAFAAGVSAHSRDGSWPADYVHADTEAFRYRRTDLHTWRTVGGAPPLSVSTDRIGIPAMRAAALLARLPGGVPLDGSGSVVEAYPAAALRIWGFAHRQYKGKARRANREQLVDEVFAAAKRWLAVDLESRNLCHESDDAFDAVVAALVARACVVGCVRPIPDAERSLAAREGWIALPAPDSFEALGVGRPT